MHPTSRPSPTGSSSRVSAASPASPASRVPTAALRHAALPPDHHLWLNGGRWWIAIVLVTTDGRRQRLRRDDVLRRLATSKHWRPAHDALASRAGAAHGEAA